MGETREVRFTVNPTNPGQYFAACGLLELADRLWHGAEGRFESSSFQITATSQEVAPLPNVIASLARGRVEAVPPENASTEDTSDAAWPLNLRLADLPPLRLDWWRDTRSGGKGLKVWAGTMHAGRIAAAMLAALRDPVFHGNQPFDVAMVVPDPEDPQKKKEPFYFDARRGAHAKARDIGFSPDAVGTTTVAYPAVELVCLIGLQRCRPIQVSATRSGNARLFEYVTWQTPLPPAVVNLAVQGLLPWQEGRGYRFENTFRTDQRKHKAFGPAIAL
jgi:hypothetical protein